MYTCQSDMLASISNIQSYHFPYCSCIGIENTLYLINQTHKIWWWEITAVSLHKNNMSSCKTLHRKWAPYSFKSLDNINGARKLLHFVVDANTSVTKGLKTPLKCSWMFSLMYNSSLLYCTKTFGHDNSRWYLGQNVWLWRWHHGSNLGITFIHAWANWSLYSLFGRILA